MQSGQELLRIVEGIARDKNISKEQVYVNIEQSIASALRKHFNVEEEDAFVVELDRETGAITASRGGEPVPLSMLGRIAAQTAKQVIIQGIRQEERGSIFEEFKDRVGTIVAGTVSRVDGPIVAVTVGRTEAIMPRSEQIPRENYLVGQRIQALVLEVRDTPGGVRVILTRSHPEFVRKLFEREVPEVSEKTIEIRGLAREAGQRTKIAVVSQDSKVDAVGACVGVRGTRIRNIVEELGGEKIDIVRWNESSQVFITNALRPAEVAEVALCFELGQAAVVVNEEQLSLAIGKQGQNVRLAARLTGWDLDIKTPAEYQASVSRVEATLVKIEGINADVTNKIIALGLIDVRDVVEVGADPLVEEAGLTAELAQKVLAACAAEAKIVEVEEAAAEAAARNAPKADAFTTMVGAVRTTVVAAQVAAQAEEAAAAAAEADAAKVPSPMEASGGGSPEVTPHREMDDSPDNELSPEEQALHVQRAGAAPEPDPEDSSSADLAEGRTPAPGAPS